MSQKLSLGDPSTCEIPRVAARSPLDRASAIACPSPPGSYLFVCLSGWNMALEARAQRRLWHLRIWQSNAPLEYPLSVLSDVCCPYSVEPWTQTSIQDLLELRRRMPVQSGSRILGDGSRLINRIVSRDGLELRCGLSVVVEEPSLRVLKPLKISGHPEAA